MHFEYWSSNDLKSLYTRRTETRTNIPTFKARKAVSPKKVDVTLIPGIL
jgi:hypothetical protein